MKNFIINTVLFIAFFLIPFSTSFAQEPQSSEKICYERAEAIEIDKGLAERDALREEKKAWQQNEKDLRNEIQKLQLDLARVTGEKIGSEAMVIRLSALVDVMMPRLRKKCIGLCVFNF